MSNRPWMPLDIGDYLEDTGHLTTVQHGAYMLLIMEYWKRGGLPDDDRRLAAYARMTPEQWADNRDTIADFFQPGWKHKRIEEELAKAEEIISKRRNAAHARHERGKSNAHAEHMQSTCSDTGALPNTTNQSSSLRSDDRAPAKPTPRQHLETVLDGDHAAALLAHRQRIGKPMTPRAAELLAGKLARCPDPNAASDAIIVNGWQGFEPEWLTNRTARAGPQALRMDDFLGAVIDQQELRNGPDPETESYPSHVRAISGGRRAG